MFFLYNFAGFNWTKQQVFLQPGSRWHLKCKAVRNKTFTQNVNKSDCFVFIQNVSFKAILSLRGRCQPGVYLKKIDLM